MTTIAFVGLGAMGGPMSANLIKAGYRVVGHNRSRAGIAQLVAAGGHGASSVEDAVHDADVIATMLPDSPEVEAVLTGEHGVFASAAPGALIVDFSTTRPDVTRRLAAQGSRAGFRMVDAPVSGGVKEAKDATLNAMAGAAVADFEAVRPVLEAIADTVVHVGPAGAGQTVKAAHQLLVAGTIELVAEAMVFLEAHGLDAEAATPALTSGLAGNAILDRKTLGMLWRDFTPGFTLGQLHKDLGNLQFAGRETGVTLPLGTTVSQLVGSLVAQGHGPLDQTALLKAVEQLSGRLIPDARRQDSTREAVRAVA